MCVSLCCSEYYAWELFCCMRFLPLLLVLKWPLENIPLNHIYLSKGSKNHLTMHMIQFSYTIYTNLAKKNMTGLMVINMLKMQYSKQL